MTRDARSSRPAPQVDDVTLVLAAMPEELEPLRERLQAPSRLPGPRGELVAGHLAGRRVLLGVTGDGAMLAGEGAAALLAWSGVRRVLGVGVAGAASDDLSVGDLVVADRVQAPDGRRLDADPALVGQAVTATQAVPAVFVTVARIADSVMAKRAALSAGRTSSGPASVIVDLESAAWAQAAADAGVPWTILRCVSDAANEALPEAFERARGRDGAVSRARVVGQLVKHPSLLPTLLRLRTRVVRCSETLGIAALALLAQPAWSEVGGSVARRVGEGARRGEGR